MIKYISFMIACSLIMWIIVFLNLLRTPILWLDEILFGVVASLLTTFTYLLWQQEKEEKAKKP